MSQPSKAGGRRFKKDASAGSEPEVKSTSPTSEQDSGILDVEDEEEDEEASACQAEVGLPRGSPGEERSHPLGLGVCGPPGCALGGCQCQADKPALCAPWTFKVYW